MENQIWYDVGGTPTKLTDIKYGSFHYHADIGASGKARLGGVCSSYVEFDYLLSNGVTFNVGDVLRYKQLFPEIDNAFESAATDLVWDGGNFYVKSVDDNGKECHIIAFDTVSKLDIDYSARLQSTESTYPHSLLWLLNDVGSLAGVTFDLAIMGDLSSFSVNYFYATGITCRDIVKAIAELCCYYVRATENDNELKFTYGGGHSNSPWQNSYRYIVCPDDGTYRDINNNIAVNVWYKENGMSLAEELTDYDGTVVYNVNGTPYGDTTATNPYKFYSANSLFSSSLRVAQSTLYNYVRVAVSNIYNANGSMMSGQIHLFPFRFPYKVGQYARIVAPDGNKYYFPIMSIDLSESDVVIESYSDKTVGAEAQNGVGSGGEDRLLTLDVRVTALEDEAAQKGSDLLLSQRNVPTTATAYACDWASYDILIINGMFYSNTVSSYVVTKDYFNDTTSGGRVMVIDPVNSNRRYAVYKKDDENIYALMESGTTGAAYGINIYGVKL